MPIINLPLQFFGRDCSQKKIGNQKKTRNPPNLSMSWCYTAATIGTTTRFAGEDLNDKVRVGGCFCMGTKNASRHKSATLKWSLFMKIREFRCFFCDKRTLYGKICSDISKKWVSQSALLLEFQGWWWSQPSATGDGILMGTLGLLW